MASAVTEYRRAWLPSVGVVVIEEFEVPAEQDYATPELLRVPTSQRFL